MSEARGKKAASSVVFKLMESVGMQLVSFVVNLLLARLLAPDDYGVLTLLMAFVAVAQVLVQSGLNTALIRKKDVDEGDLSSAFWISMLIAGAVYAALFAAAPVIARIYDAPELTAALRVLALMLFPGALVSVQTAVVSRQMAFRRLMVCSLSATVLSGATGVGMALAGFGYWALVSQQLINQTALAVLLLAAIRWYPRLLLSWQRVKELWRFSWKLLISSLLDTGYINLRSMLIGVRYTSEMLAYYNRGRQFPELVMNAVNGSISSVMLPVLSEAQDDLPRMKGMMRRGMLASFFVVLPLMAGLAAVAEPLISWLLTDKWLPCVPFLQILAIDYALYPIHTTNLSAINAVGRSDIFLKLEIIKKVYGMILLVVSVFCFGTVEAIAWGAVISSVGSVFVNAWPSRKLVGYSVWEQIRDMTPALLLALGMFAALRLLGAALALTPALETIVLTLCGMALYIGAAVVLKLEAGRFLLDTLKSLRKK